MTDHILGDRRAALENAFFAEQDAALRRRLREKDVEKTRKEALSAASGIKEDEVLNSLIEHNITATTFVALSLIPLVAVAWADGRMEAKEHSAILSSAEQAGLIKQDASHQLLEGWLRKMPPPTLIVTWKAYVSALSTTLSEDEREALKTKLIGQVRAVAEATGGIMGLRPRISANEAAILKDLEQAF